MSEHDDFKPHAEPDLPATVNRHIWGYFILLGVLLFLTIGGLTIMFRFQVQWEKSQKVGRVVKRETLDYRLQNEAFLSGKVGVFENKKNVPIKVAMDKFIRTLRRSGD